MPRNIISLDSAQLKNSKAGSSREAESESDIHHAVSQVFPAHIDVA